MALWFMTAGLEMKLPWLEATFPDSGLRFVGSALRFPAPWAPRGKAHFSDEAVIMAL